MKEKKQSSSWYIAATHYLTAGFAIPFVVNLIALFIVVPFLVATGFPAVVFAGILAINLVAIWLGVMYSANYVKKTYIISDHRKVVKFSTSYLVVLFGGFLIFSQVAQGVSVDGIVFLVINFVTVVAVFYFFSTKYLRATPDLSVGS